LILSGVAIAPAMDQAPHRPLGATILAAVEATRRVVRTNSNLGMVLLLAPLCTAATGDSLQQGVATALNQLTADDSRLVYQAIRLANPGALGEVDSADVAGDAPDDLLAAMRLAADRDLVARQYANGFAEVFGQVAPTLTSALGRYSLLDAIVYTYLATLANHADSLIARKCGIAVAARASQQAGQIIDSAQPGDEFWHEMVADFDFWLRADGHRRNPGTTADLVTAALFVALWEGSLSLADACI
jgi:triphosphoribosyl-dephospho-CoA synthase